VPSTVLPVPTALMFILSYRSTPNPEARTRMRWVLLTLLAAGIALLLLWTLPNALGRAVPPENLLPLLFLPPTLALGAAILRYRLFDVEVIVRRSLLYGSLTACIVAVYLTGAWLLTLMPGVRPPIAAVVASGLVAVIAPPLRSSLHRVVGHMVFGDRDDPFEVISRLGRIDAAAEPQHVLQDVVETLARTLRLSSVSIELRSASRRFAVEASHGRSTGVPMILPLGVSGELGQLLATVNPGHEPFGPADRRLLDALARQVSAAAATVLLTTELQQSRAQIVAAREDERRRLHHRLHDGLGPDLAAGVMRLEVVSTLLRRDPDRAAEFLAAQIASARELIGEVRGVIYGLRPPALDQLGLAGALRTRITNLAQPGPDGEAAMKVTMDEEGPLDDLPAAVEVAAFWITVEAVSNAVRHAHAKQCTVRLVRARNLEVEILDDGRGLPTDVIPGGGLVSMRERAEELGGECTIRSGAERGTVVRARLPIREWRALDER
jgi:two-component system NarL family sensor kinase